MTKIIKSFIAAFSLIIIVLCPLYAKGESRTRDGITVTFEELADNTIRVKFAENRSSNRVTITIDGRESAVINANSSAQIQKIAKRSVGFSTAKGSGPTLWRFQPPKVEEPAPEPVKTEVPRPETPDRQASKPEIRKKEESVAKSISQTAASSSTVPAELPSAGDYPVIDKINQDPFFGQDAVNDFVLKCEDLSNGLMETNNKERFITDNDIQKFINESETEISSKKDEIPGYAAKVISSTRTSDVLVNLVVETLNNRLNERRQALQELKATITNVKDLPAKSDSKMDDIINYIILSLILIIIAFVAYLIIKKKKKPVKTVPVIQTSKIDENSQPAIVVRRRTATILKKQCLDDVVSNPAYMQIDSVEFTPDSAIGKIYIKNTCIKEIYNLYAEDLRNSENPKEDGCMVLGRWVLDNETGKYDISLEYVVFPEDDAVFKEYELNFGGKIKLRIAEKLRKLRRETDLQYDLVCWIHSHPGLGVFFSNSDDNVQMQLRHSQHPNFLIALVVDILTSDQETGIFTFRTDGTMNSKGDLIKLYSLEEMYKWALESDKISFNPENYYNLLQKARIKLPVCKGIEVNNSSIIDLTQLLIKPGTGIIGSAIGTTIESPEGKEYLISGIVENSEDHIPGKIGVAISVTHFSLPTIQRLIQNENAGLNFVLVYSSRLNTLTSIPVINGEVMTDEQFYGDETIDNLKIWTRRKR